MLYFFEEDACTELLCSLAGHAISTGVPLVKDNICCIYIYVYVCACDDLWHVPLGKNAGFTHVQSSQWRPYLLRQPQRFHLFGQVEQGHGLVGGNGMI